MSADKPYNPLEKVHLGASVADALLTSSLVPMAAIEPFSGAGIYAIYYSGAFPAYQKLAQVNKAQGPVLPIYVGKAIPQGGRKGLATLVNRPSRVLFRRLNEHAESIRATDLDLNDFTCRYLAVDDIWIPLGESLLIARFSPLWNVFLDGFGNHDPGSGRYQGLAPKWDVLHPGRSWAQRCKPRAESAKQISAETMAWLNQAPALAQSRYTVREAVAKYEISKLDDGASEIR